MPTTLKMALASAIGAGGSALRLQESGQSAAIRVSVGKKRALRRFAIAATNPRDGWSAEKIREILEFAA
jgi:hypothetical protein